MAGNRRLQAMISPAGANLSRIAGKLTDRCPRLPTSERGTPRLSPNPALPFGNIPNDP
jgi:hypothetical protein